MKVDEIRGADLDYCVAKALGYDAVIECQTIISPNSEKNMTCLIVVDQKVEGAFRLYGKYYLPFQPRKDWSQGGPIIERYKIAVEPVRNESIPFTWQAYFPNKSHTSGWYSRSLQYGNTPLEAVTKCYFVSEYGDDDEGMDEDEDRELYYDEPDLLI